MTPTVVLDEEGVPWIAAGASGGPFIISSTLQVLSNVLDYGLDPAEAVSAPRMHHQWTPRLLFLDHLGHPREVQETLRERGHQLELFPFFSSTQLAVRIDELYLGASDPRKGGQAVGAQLP